MRQFRTNTKIWAAIAGVIVALTVRSELARRRRQMHAYETPRDARSDSSFVVAYAVDATAEDNVKSAAGGGDDRRVRRLRRTESAPARRRLPRTVVAGAVAALALVPAMFALHPQSTHAVATIHAEAADTPDGVMMMAHGSGFAPGQSVQLYWQHQAMGTVTTTASPSGEVEAAMALPDADAMSMADATGAIPLTATDGTNIATQPVPVAPPSSAVLAASGGSRVTVNGAPYFLLGANYPWLSYGNDFGSNAWGSFGVHSSADYAADFADMKAKGVHMVRWWLFTDGRAGINYAADGTPLGVQPVVYDDLNAAIAMARQNGIYLDLVLFDFTLLNNGSNSGGVQIGGRSSLISDPNKRAALVNNVIRPLAQAYGSEPVIASWELMNEPEWVLSDLPQPAVNSGAQPVTMQQFWSYGSAASQMLHMYTHSMVTVGSASLKWNAVWTDAFAASRGLPALHLDFYQTHYYPWMDGWVLNDPVLGHTTLSPLTQAVSGLNLDKPIVVGEISTPSGQAGNLLNTILANGYAGFWGWSYNSNNTGDKLAIDWGTFTPWEQAHASIVRIPAAGAPTSASPTPKPATATNTARPNTPTATNTVRPNPTATNTPRPAPPTATNTPRPSVPTATNTPQPSAPTATRTATPRPSVPTNTAVPNPISVMRSFGRITTAGVNDSADYGFMNGTYATLPTLGTLRALSVYVGATQANAHVRLGIYTDANGAPGTLVDQTAPRVTNLGWNVLPVLGSTILKPGGYWIVAQTDSAGTVYRTDDGLSGSSIAGYSRQRYGAFPQTERGWHAQPGAAFSMFGTVELNADATAPESLPTSTATVAVPRNETPTQVATKTNTPTPIPTAAPTATATPTQGAGGSNFDQTVCAVKLDPRGHSQCGNPVNFCDTWVGGFCNDYRDRQTPSGQETAFPQPRDHVSLDCLSVSSAAQASFLPYYNPTNNSDNTDVPGSELIPMPCGMSFMEHFMTRMEDGQFGEVIMRQQQPFDFAGRTGHIHFDVDLKTLSRRYVRVVLSPQLTKSATDDRHTDRPEPQNAFEIWFSNGQAVGLEDHNGVQTSAWDFGCNGCGWRYYGTDNVRDSIDIYVSRTHTQIVVNGSVVVDKNTPDIGFDRAYMYLEHVNYNSCKAYAEEHYATIAECQLDGNMFHWDNIAFDGPVLPINGLTPVGSEDVVFNAYSQASCRVKGVAAASVNGSSNTDVGWVSWVARLPAHTAVAPSDVVCVAGPGGGDDYRGVPMGLEIVQQP